MYVYFINLVKEGAGRKMIYCRDLLIHQIGFNVVALVVTVSIFTWLVTGLALISADKVVLKCKKSEIEYL